MGVRVTKSATLAVLASAASTGDEADSPVKWSGGGAPGELAGIGAPVACTCEDALWRGFRDAAVLAFTPEFPRRMVSRGDPVHHWLRMFSPACPDISSSKYRGLASLSDCAPGVLMLHVACSQSLLLQLRFQDAQDQLIEALQVLPFAEPCLGDEAQGVVTGWPITRMDLYTNYVRMYRGLSYYFASVELVPDFAWRPSRNCVVDMDCPNPEEVCVSYRCTKLTVGEEGSDCRAAARGACPGGSTCTAAFAPTGSDCVQALAPLCVVGGELEAFHPSSECLPISSTMQPRLLKACSEMGTTLYNLNWTSVPYQERVENGVLAGEGASDDREAFVLPVTLRLQSPWHAIHSLVPAYAQVNTDARYSMLGKRGEVEIILVDQDLNKDRHIWSQLLGEQDEDIGPFDFLVRAIADLPYRMLADVKGPRCYRRVIWGHELMLYSGGGFTNSSHVRAFVDASRMLVSGPVQRSFEGRARQPQLLLVERRNASAWGRWIDNFDTVELDARRFSMRHPELVAGVQKVDLADLPVADQLRLASAMTIMFGAHGDGLTWAVFMREGGALLEAVPGRRNGFQVCVEGVGENPWGIFGGLARLAKLTHACWLNAESALQPVHTDPVDIWQWNWRSMNIHIDLAKFEFFLGEAAKRAFDADVEAGMAGA